MIHRNQKHHHENHHNEGKTTVSSQTSPGRTLYVGSFTSERTMSGDGVTALAVSPGAAEFRTLGHTASRGCPNFLALHPEEDFVYATSETPEGGVYTYAIRSDGSLELRSEQQTTSNPAHIAVGRVGESLFAVTSSYWDGYFGVHRILHDGTVGPLLSTIDRNAVGDDGVRPTSRAHCSVFAPSGRFVIATDLGQDQVITYQIDEASGELSQLNAFDCEPGTGPRHLAWHPDGRVFVSGELSGTISVFRVDDETGELTLLERRDSRADPADPELASPPAQPSEIALSHGGRFVHIGNRQLDVISTFSTTGDTLEPVSDTPTGGKIPRHFAVVDDEMYVGNQDSDSLVAFHVDPDNGHLERFGAAAVTPSIACVVVRR
ncbi:MAG: lactonase family protein [Actinomycetota bacterium]|nr:lactonase family protein [Actinomycetota bacterium]